jgi:prevent-host-death family protein
VKLVEKSDATESLSDYADEIGKGPVIVTSKGRPIAALVSIENADLETVSLSTNPQFLELIERSRARARKEGTISASEMRRQFKP